MKSSILIAISSLFILLPVPVTSAKIPDVSRIRLTTPQPAETISTPVFAVQRPAKPMAVLIAQKAITTLKTSVFSPNTYYWGQCVWYVKERRPELPNTWHDATDWLYHAKADGWATGSVPKVGAVGWVYGHVVYIERVNGDGTVYFSEMNVLGVGVKSYRTKPASYFTYIY